jgi:hypothetical protein
VILIPLKGFSLRISNKYGTISNSEQIPYVCVKSVSNMHRLSNNRPTKRGKEKSPSDGHCQCQKEIDNHLLACQQILEIEPHSYMPC